MTIQSYSGKAVPIFGNDIDTDRIVPARFLREVTFDNMGEYLFYDVRYVDGVEVSDFPLNQKQYHGASIMVVEHNFGCGSSREHAPQSIKRAGFNVIIGESFAEIFSGNCKSLGIVTGVLDRQHLDVLMAHVQAHPSAEYVVDVDHMIIHTEGLSLNIKIKDAHRAAFLDGSWDELGVLKANQEKIQKTANALPYIQWR